MRVQGTKHRLWFVAAVALPIPIVIGSSVGARAETLECIYKDVAKTQIVYCRTVQPVNEDIAAVAQVESVGVPGAPAPTQPTQPTVHGFGLAAGLSISGSVTPTPQSSVNVTKQVGFQTGFTTPDVTGSVAAQSVAVAQGVGGAVSSGPASSSGSGTGTGSGTDPTTSSGQGTSTASSDPGGASASGGAGVGGGAAL